MHTKQGIRIPLSLIVLDVIGAAAAGIGLASYFGGIELVPAPFRFAHYDAVLIVAGMALMMPLVYHLLTQALARGAEPRP